MKKYKKKKKVDKLKTLRIKEIHWKDRDGNIPEYPIL